jgi:mRNA interferase MazF
MPHGRICNRRCGRRTISIFRFERRQETPALVVATLTGNDVILCQITSQAVVDTYAVQLHDTDFTSGGLRQASNVRPNRLFTAETSIILYRAGTISAAKMQEVRTKLMQILTM